MELWVERLVQLSKFLCRMATNVPSTVLVKGLALSASAMRLANSSEAQQAVIDGMLQQRHVPRAPTRDPPVATEVALLGEPLQGAALTPHMARVEVLSVMAQAFNSDSVGLAEHGWNHERLHAVRDALARDDGDASLSIYSRADLLGRIGVVNSAAYGREIERDNTKVLVSSDDGVLRPAELQFYSRVECQGAVLRFAVVRCYGRVHRVDDPHLGEIFTAETRAQGLKLVLLSRIHSKLAYTLKRDEEGRVQSMLFVRSSPMSGHV